MAQKLLTKALAKKLPALYSQEDKTAAEVKVPVKFFTPWANWTWYATEFDGEDTFFGWCAGPSPELGYFSLAELQSLKGPVGLTVERDAWWDEATTLAEVKEGAVT